MNTNFLDRFLTVYTMDELQNVHRDIDKDKVHFATRLMVQGFWAKAFCPEAMAKAPEA